MILLEYSTSVGTADYMYACKSYNSDLFCNHMVECSMQGFMHKDYMSYFICICLQTAQIFQNLF